jgi:RNA polymerase sigma-70 factor (ECF subfamily)
MIPSPPETRASLILRLRDAADVAAWDEVVAVYGPLVFRMAQKQGLQPTDAEDAVQEVFAAVARSVDQWTQQSHKGRFRSWLLGITRNIAINILTRRPQGTVGQGGADTHPLLADIPVTDNPLSGQFDLEYRREVYRWAAEQVRLAVSPATWNAFQLTHVEAMPIAKAAQQLGTSVGNVYIARSRVMKRLREVATQFEVTE